MTLLQVAVVLTSTSLVLYATMMGLFARAVLGRQKATRPAASPPPRVTILKPLAGWDDDLDENLETFARLQYPSFEILFGVADRADPAFGVARRFAAKHPELAITTVLTDPSAAVNPKVAQLVGLDRVATGEVFVVSDSNIRVRPTYLWSMVNELQDDRVGIVTSLFAGGGERSLGAALENLQLCACTAPCCAALDATRRPLTVGKSMAFRRRDLAALGGFGAVGHVLAEDHLLGRRFMEAGFDARLAGEIVENRNTTGSVRRTLARHTRWSQVRRSLYPVASLVEPILTPVVVATLGVLIAPSRTTAGLLAFVCVFQTVSAMMAVRLIRGTSLAWYLAPLENRSFLRVPLLLGPGVLQPADRLARPSVSIAAGQRDRALSRPGIGGWLRAR